ncbi:MAG: hypothetical protein GEU94_09325 [Micromonosporaceae bacterium]|nr:hypothetical protein [Micromonosporaceae bacterium]
MTNHDAGTDYLPVYHTTAQAHALHFSEDAAEPDVDWAGFARAVLAAHQPDGDECAGCGRPWACCPVTVAARQHGLRLESLPCHEIRDAAPRRAAG